MTGNHLLLNRLAELMLVHEQHILPVDLLFDDEQIGDFVKSIQIDSPYQQMLLEGVLTESVRDEKLYVSFTVEGYFHFVLGEVIHNRIEGLGTEALKRIVDENKLNGAKEGVEQCLIRDMEKDDLSRLIWLIDQGGAYLEACIMPLALAFTQVKGNPKTEEEIEKAHRIQIKKVMDYLIFNPTDNDILVLEKAILKVKETRIRCLHFIYEIVKIKIKHTNVSIILKLEAFKVLELKINPQEFKTFKDLIQDLSIKKRILALMEIASLYSSMNDYKNELKYTEKCIKLLKKYVITDIEIAALYHNQVLALIEQGLYKDCESILNKAIESKPKVLHHTYNAFTNLYTHLNRFQEAQDYATRVLALRRESFGSYHPQTAVALNNLGLCCYYSGNINQGINFIQESLIIREKILGRDNELTLQTRVNIAGILKNSDINSAEEQINLALLLMTKKSPLMSSALEVKGMILNNTGRIELAVDCFQKSLVLNRVFHGDIHPYTKISYRELGKIFLKMKKIQKAKIYFKKALNIDIKIYGQEDVNTAMSLNNLGNVFQENNEIKKALINFEKAHTIFLNALGLEHEHTKLLAKKLNELNDI